MVKALKKQRRDWSLPVAAITEALDYYQRFHDVIEADAAEELALERCSCP